MSFIFNVFLLIPFVIRVAVFLFILLVAWRFLGRGLLWIFSVIPFLLSKLFNLLYQAIEIPLAMLHQKCGGGFYAIDNFAAGLGEGTDGALRYWYQAWHSRYKFEWGKAIAVYAVCLIFIVFPSAVPLENDLLRAGETLYLSGEGFLKELLEKPGSSGAELIFSADNGERPENNEAYSNPKIELIVSNVNSALLVRDVPDMENGTALERLYNGNTVTWTGELVFAEAENNRVEAWVKVITGSGTKGWSRLFYLHPTDYADEEFYVVIMHSIG